ncbi:MAG TPA: sugar transferase [Oligoflexia bacterium]|nr:sugar transferase [Oligoflexia bacterium]
MNRKSSGPAGGSWYRAHLKRLLDIVLSAGLLAALSPLLMLIVIILAAANRGKVFFLQQRSGYLGQPFIIWKFKTMRDSRGTDGQLLPDDLRITRLGRLIRAFSLDELLQLVNVIRGEMSLVGPRPLLMEYLPLYNEFQHRRHEVRPGITGLAQVRGRNNTTWRRRFRYDVFYVEHVSLLFDLRILAETAAALMHRSGVEGRAGVTMEKFQGN